MTTILVVEDEAMIRDMIERMLKISGYQVLTAGDGARAVDLAQESLPDLILMDMGLPVLNGWQATHRIKSRDETRPIPVIALTAYALTEDRERCFAVGCDEYETKPIEFPRLLTKIRALLQSQRTRVTVNH
ncbi:MAG TPA: response regulator [Kouleothrix sp.]|jgi:CheY-like chemotaxis protein|uniref:response regulator n=1 Tax=Kouleothrix sp. TaxID=2779161 RepID=UPI002D07FD8B|nr:response regulator [Kouleothrix sp.]HRC74749.1 response regulator [Kouleothrix sp.]